MASEHEELNEVLKAVTKKRRRNNRDCKEAPCAPTHAQGNGEKGNTGGYKQFTTGDDIHFFPAGDTIPTLKPGVYETGVDPVKGLYFEKLNVKTDSLIRFPETNSEKVIMELQKFWDREEKFYEHNVHYKRGIILWGPPGSGKSCTIQLVVEDVIKRGGVCFKFGVPQLFLDGIRIFREVQPDTPVVVLMEDIDSTIEMFNESDVLQILDGVDQVEKVVYLATTNHPERLGPRIMNRPSRFDKRFKMGHPKAISRKLYFEHRLDEDSIKEYDIKIDKWVEDTKGMSIAHLKELFISVCIFGNDYDEAIGVLKTMVEFHPNSSTDDMHKQFGFGRKINSDEVEEDW